MEADRKYREEKKKFAQVGVRRRVELAGLEVSKGGKTVSREKNWRTFGSRQICCLCSIETVDWSVVYS